MANPVLQQWLIRPGGLAAELRTIRVTAGLSGRSLAETLGWTPYKVSKVEHGRQLITADEIRAWCEACGAPPRQTAQLVDLLARSRSIGLDFEDKLSGGQEPVQATYVELLARSTNIAYWLPDLIPGPLQIPAYARGVLEASARRFGSDPPADLDAAVAARMEGGQYLYHQGKHFTFLLWEPALHVRYSPTEVMVAQLDRLATALDLPGVYIGIVPLDIQLPTLLPANFAIFDRLALVETLTSEHAYEGPDVDAWWRAVEELKAVAVAGAEAQDVLRSAVAAVRAT